MVAFDVVVIVLCHYEYGNSIYDAVRLAIFHTGYPIEAIVVRILVGGFVKLSIDYSIGVGRSSAPNHAIERL